MKHFIKLSRDGEVSFIMTNELSGMGRTNSVVRRATHVVPTGWWKRMAFYIIRFFAGDIGRIPEWTRNWNTQWSINMSPVGGSWMGPFDDRKLAIEAEVRELIRMGLPKPKTWAERLLKKAA